MELKIIAKIKSDFPTKFGIPRQSCLVSSLISYIEFEKEYSVPEAFRGIDEYSHIHIIWGFSEAFRESWTPTVRPPRLGGNKRIGVFATRSPYRPNSIGLSTVELISVQKIKGRIVLEVAGADLMDGTPIYDIKPYLSFTDSHPNAKGGFADEVKDKKLDVIIPRDLMNSFEVKKMSALNELLSQDPRPSYQNEPERIYGFVFSGREVKFKVDGKVLIVTEII